VSHGCHPVSEISALLTEARAAIAGRALLTPLVPAGARQTPGGNPIWLKAESLQPSGSFKIRGATFRLSRLREAERRAGVIAYSTGNHAQSVALAARQLGIPATIVMSPDAPAYKVEATRGYGARVVMAEPTSEARRELAEEIARIEGLALIPPYDHVDVMAGQGTIGLEILEQVEPAAIFVPVGGGGLIAGIACAVKERAPGVRVIGVEPAWEDDAARSFRLGERVRLPAASQSIADAIRVQMLGEFTFPLIRRYVDDIMTVAEEAIASATLLAFHEAHLVLEPAGAVGLAGALAYTGPQAPRKPVVAVASGGNITLDQLSMLKGRPM
jgi:threonine dehydratase